MIQRIQTIYLLLAAILTGLMTAFDLAIYSIEDVLVYTYSVYKIVPVNGGEVIIPGNWIVQVSLIAAICLLTIFTLFQYKNRKMQLKMGKLNYLLMLTLIISTYLSIKSTALLLEDGEELKTLYYIGFYLPVAAITFLFLANRGIKKDEELVRSVERLR